MDENAMDIINDEKENYVPAEAVEMAEYAYTTVPLYIEIAKGLGVGEMDFKLLPIVKKENYMNPKAAYISLNYFQRYLDKQLIIRKTSGSTGKITDYYWNYEDESKSLFELWFYRKEYYHITPADKMVLFFPIAEEEEEFTRNNNILGLSKAFMYNERMEEAYNKILEFHPKWMILQPSVAWMLCNIIEQKQLPIIDSVDYIEFTGEYLEESVREKVEKIFNCRTANQYGMGEVNSISYECPCGNMHVMGSNVYVEILNKHDEIGDICVTSLKNMAMPLIRYNTGDKGYLTFQNCACGNRNPILIVCNGRDNDWVRKENGKVLHPFSLLQVINEANHRTQGVIFQYQIIQKDYGSFEFNLVVKEGTDLIKLEECLCNLTAHRLQENLTLSFSYYDQIIPDKETGKIAAFFCEINQVEQESN